ncbi:hypothetical protein BH24PSE2_BH24PSE2_17480 [soil metagenome]
MRNAPSCLSIVVCLCLIQVSPSARAKAETIQINIYGASLSNTIELTDQEIVSRFSIWNGPGTKIRIKGEPARMDVSGTFVDWSAGEAEQRPDDLQQYRVQFLLGFEEGSTSSPLTYDVSYAFAPERPGGYMFLPAGNTSLIYHGVEGSWFRSSDAWEQAIRPIIERAGRTATTESLEFTVAPIDIELNADQRRLLTTPSPTALSEAGREDFLQFVWSAGQLGSLGGERAFTLEIKILPTASIEVEDTIVALLESLDGRLTIFRDDGPETWHIEPANYSVHVAKINYMPDGRVIPLLPIKLVEADSNEAAFGHLAVFCELRNDEHLSCDDLQFVFSESAAKDRSVAGTVEEILAR